ncbi:MAG: SDR family NAD(P)-dependent oxidoreductase, partial [Gemmataceae bacterium]
ANVGLVDREPDVEFSAASLGRDHKIKAVACQGDATDYPAMQRAAADMLDKLGRVDHLVFAVGIGSGKFGFPYWNLEPGDWGKVFDVNVLSAACVVHAFTPHFIERKSGTLLFISSVAGQIGSQTDPPYSASKAALINFAQCAAKDLASYNVRVNTICPGMIKSVLNRAVWEAWYRQQPEDQRQAYEDWAGEKIRKVIPLGRWQEPEDVANLAVFLASPRAGNITGQTLNVDGGFVMHW